MGLPTVSGGETQLRSLMKKKVEPHGMLPDAETTSLFKQMPTSECKNNGDISTIVTIDWCQQQTPHLESSRGPVQLLLQVPRRQDRK